MECANCEIRQRHFFCVNCLRAHLRDFRAKAAHAGADRDEQIARAARALTSADELRARRASLAAAQARAAELAGALDKVRRSNDELIERLRARRAAIAARRRTLATARALPASGSSSISTALSSANEQLGSLSAALAQARTGLVQELVEVFDVVEVGGRPAVGGRPGTKGEWTIGGLVLPVPGDVRRYPPDHINAALTHALHFIGLLAFYLGVKLPFTAEWPDGGERLGVGTPRIGAIRGTEAGNWARWHAKHPLHLSLDPATAPDAAPGPDALYASYTAPAAAVATSPPPGAFTTALAMLLYDVAYLAYTQAVDVPLAGAGDALGNLWQVCCAPALGRRSHESGAPPGAPAGVQDAMPGAFAPEPAGAPRVLPPPTPPGFALDFAQVLQATAAGPRRAQQHRDGRARREKERERERRQRAPLEEDEWDMVEVDEERELG